jgi:hypothetical protein
MEVRIRDYSPGDADSIIRVWKDSSRALRKSRGGLHPDSDMDRLLASGDKKKSALGAFSIHVAEAEGKVVGFRAFSDRLLDRFLGSSYGGGVYVAESFQRGKKGVNVGTLLTIEGLEKQRTMGFRKHYSYSVPEAVDFHRRFGARFYPFHDRFSDFGRVRLAYYEIELRPSFLNALRIEPFIHETRTLCGKILWRLRKTIPAFRLRNQD